ncbi:PIN domain-containing protein [Paracoccus onubensis]|uniref:PIN domain-containing protein n=1 Tax=Paracoccus onubensis TaxID=1675788 RepID=UPI00272F568A|nr:PIN domain-containing protein [Paracoccus onubensis]MDP0929706.1 PIN domain-containing protein [Paracoccus onubensis]
MYLLDTNIISASAPTRRDAGADTLGDWIRAHSDGLYLSAITIAEIEAGIARAVRIGATTKAAALRRWLAAVEHFHASRILPFGVSEAREAGAILDRARAHDPGFEDIAIAATAAAHGLTVLTANERHFAPLGVPYMNPLKELPAT